MKKFYTLCGRYAFLLCSLIFIGHYSANAANPKLSVLVVNTSASSTHLVYNIYLRANKNGTVDSQLNAGDIYYDYQRYTYSLDSVHFADSFSIHHTYGKSQYSSNVIGNHISVHGGSAYGGDNGNNYPADTDGTQYNEIDIHLDNGASTTSGTPISQSGWTTFCTISFSIVNSSASPIPPFYFDQSWSNWSIANTNGYNTTTFNAGQSPTFPVVDNTLFSIGSTNFYDDATWNLGVTPSGLPVTLTSFTANLDDGITKLNWNTSSELNNNYFTMERSADGLHFETLFTMPGNGTTNEAHNYTGYDEQPLPGISYYRLTQTDYNGALHIYNIVEVNNSIAGQFAINSVSPTAFTDQTTMYYKMPAEASVRLVVTNLSGKIVEDIMVPSQYGYNKYTFDNTSGWQPGVYLATLYYQEDKVYSKMVKN